MATPPLLDATDLSDLPGAPFSAGSVQAAAASVRRKAGWHIAPSVTETITTESRGGYYLFLPTMRLTDVTAVRDVTDPAASVDLAGWSPAATPRFRAGCLRRSTPWPCAVLEVDVVHGYDSCPDDLLSVVAEICRRRDTPSELASRSLGDLSQTWRDQLSPESHSTISAFTIPRIA